MQTLRSKYNRKKPVSYLFSQNRKPWPGFGPGTFALPRQAINLDNDDEYKMTASMTAGAVVATTSKTSESSSSYISAFQLDSSFWVKYNEFLSKKFNRHTAKCRILYAKNYSYVLRKSDARDLLLLSNEKRIHIMKALSTLSKFLGCYDKWKLIIQSYQLKWCNEDSDIKLFNNIMINGQENYNSMIEWLNKCCSQLSSPYRNILLFNVLTGLRPDEACKSIALLQREQHNYLNKDLMILEHFKYPERFIRRTKKAYISIMTEKIMKLAEESSTCSYNALRLAVKRKGLDMNMAYCRKIFATHLRSNGIEQEIIDLLQGRTPKTVFAKHYFRPNLNYDKIRDLLEPLYEIVN